MNKVLFFLMTFGISTNLFAAEISTLDDLNRIVQQKVSDDSALCTASAFAGNQEKEGVINFSIACDGVSLFNGKVRAWEGMPGPYIQRAGVVGKAMALKGLRAIGTGTFGDITFGR